MGFLPIFCPKYRKNTPNKKRGLRKRGFVDSRESTNPPFFFKGGGFWFWGFCLFFALNIGKKHPNKKRGLRKRGFVDSRPLRRGGRGRRVRSGGLCLINPSQTKAMKAHPLIKVCKADYQKPLVQKCFSAPPCA